MRNKVLGAIGVLWGGAIVVRWFTVGPATEASSSYQEGQFLAMLFGVGMLAAGLYYFFKKTE